MFELSLDIDAVWYVLKAVFVALAYSRYSMGKLEKLNDANKIKGRKT